MGQVRRLVFEAHHERELLEKPQNHGYMDIRNKK
jgi:hypothetical protein